MPRNGLRGFTEMRCNPDAHDPRDIPKAADDRPRCLKCGAVLRSGSKMKYCSPHYMGEVDIPDIIIEVVENAGYIEQIANLIRDDIMSPEAKEIFLEMYEDDSTKKG